MPDPEHADVGTAKALANPVRQRILRELDIVGEATSTTLAGRLGITTGGTSYNLRVLADHGFVEEIPERSAGRERWWRKVPRDVRFGARTPEMRTAVAELGGLWFAEDVATFARFQERKDDLGEWADAVPFSRGSLRVDLADLAAFYDDYLALLKKYQQGLEKPGARTVLARFIAFPDPGVR
ncbi:ArsR/SmtB family transcription factor [Actinokineospora sp. HUAS TT18]|uniref:ArsR/SmtB family transcription factor n=1 Tax=Actinokineospora sp. HUAS TT18 TaxID=3447451 RepID=UPI003F5285A1